MGFPAAVCAATPAPPITFLCNVGIGVKAQTTISRTRPQTAGVDKRQTKQHTPPVAQLTVDKQYDMFEVAGHEQTLAGGNLVARERVHVDQVLL